MPIQTAGSVRALALAGPTNAGKTTLLEALLLATGAVERRPDGAAAERVGDSSPEARAYGHSVELNLADFEFMGDRYAVIDCPGSLEFCADLDAALPAVDLAVVVAEPDPAKAALLQPTLRQLEELGVPHALFINKMDHARGSLQDLLLDLFRHKTTAVMTNVPGPRERLRMLGSTLEQAMFWVPQSGDVGLGVSVLSYGGGVQFGVLADKLLCPDPRDIIDRFEPEFAKLALAVDVLGRDPGFTLPA